MKTKPQEAQMEHREMANVQRHTTAVKHQAHTALRNQKTTTTAQQRHLVAMQRPTKRKLPRRQRAERSAAPTMTVRWRRKAIYGQAQKAMTKKAKP